MKWNTIATVIDLIEAETREQAIEVLEGRLREQGFEIYEDGYHNVEQAFVSEDEETVE